MFVIPHPLKGEKKWRQLLNKEQKAQGCDATEAKLIIKSRAHKNYNRQHEEDSNKNDLQKNAQRCVHTSGHLPAVA